MSWTDAYQLLKNYQRTVLLFLLGGLFLVTLFDRGGVHYTSFLLLSLFMLLFAAVALLPNQIVSHRQLLTLWISLLSFVGLFFISYFFSETANVGFPELVSTFAGAVTFYLLSRQSFTLKQIYGFLEWVLFLAVITSFLGLCFFYSESFNRVAGTFRDFAQVYSFFPNALANFLLMVLPISAYLWLRRQASTPRFFMAVFVFLALIFFMTFSRGAFLVLLGELVLFVIGGLFLLKFKHFSGYFARIAIGLVGAFILSSLLVGIKPDSTVVDQTNFTDKATLSSNEGISSVSERVDFWRASLDMINDNPIFGTGPGSFAYVFPHYQRQMLATSDHPHNIFLKLAVEHGVVVSGAFAAFLILLFWYFWVLVKTVRGESRPLAFVLAVAAIGGFAHNLLDYNFNFVTNVLLWWVLLGLIFSLFSQRTSVMTRLKGLFWQRFPLWKTFILSVTIFLFIVGAFQTFYTIQFRLGSAAFAAEDYPRAVWYFQRAERLIFKRNLYVDTALVYRQMYLQDHDIIWLNRAQEALNKHLNLNRHDAFAWALLAQIEEDLPNGATTSEEQYLLRALQLDAYNNLAYYNELMHVYLRENNARALTAWFPYIDRILGDYTEKLRENAHLTVLTGNPDAALRLCAVMVHLVRGDEFANDYQARCETIEELFDLEAAKFEQAYGVQIDEVDVSFRRI